MKVFTHSLQSEDDTPVLQKEEEVHTEIGSSYALDTDSNTTDPNPSQSEPLSTNISTSQDTSVPREDSIPQMMEKQEMDTSQRTVDDQSKVAEDTNKEHEVSTPTTPMLDPVVPVLRDSTAKKEDSSNLSAGSITD